MTMTTAPEKMRIWERASDWFNPILVKETRQALKGRAFAIAFALLLTACWMISFFGALGAGVGIEYYSYSSQFFNAYFMALCGALLIVVPFMTYWSMLTERQEDTFEVLSITSLNARKIVNGKLINAIVQSLLFFAAIVPFISFTSLLQGFRITPVFLSLLVVVVVSAGLSALGLLVSTLARNRLIQGFFLIVLVAFLFWACFMVVGFATVGLVFMPDDAEIWAGVLTTVALLVGLILLIREVAISQITFESDNRSTGTRLVTSGILIAGWAALPLVLPSSAMPGFWPYAVGQWAIGSCLLLSAVAFFICTEPVHLSRRLYQKLPRNPLLKRIAFPFLPGCARGYCFILLHVLPIFLGCLYLSMRSIRSSEDMGGILIALCYVMVYSGLASLISQVLRKWSTTVRSAHVRSSFLILISVAAIIPHFYIVLAENVQYGTVPYAAWMVLSPFATLFEFGMTGLMDQDMSSALIILCVASFGLLLCNVGAILASMAEMKTGRKQADLGAKAGMPPGIAAKKTSGIREEGSNGGKAASLGSDEPTTVSHAGETDEK